MADVAHTPDATGRQMSSIRWLTLAGVVGPLAFWTVLLPLGVMMPDYSAVSDVISDLGAIGAPYGLVQQLNFIVLGIGVIAFAVAMDRQFREGGRPWVGVVLIGMFGLFGAIGSGVFPLTPANPDSTTNMLHAISAIVGFLSGVVGIPLTSWNLYKTDRWPGYSSRGTVVAVTLLVIGAFVLFLLSNGTSWPGLAQRLFAGVLTLWVAYHSFTLYKIVRPQ